jgi:hypothetical protein
MDVIMNKKPNVKNVTFTEFKEFILSQPDDRLIDLLYISPCDLGCPLVHFVRNKFKRKVLSAGFSMVRTDRDVISFESSVGNFSSAAIQHRVENYKQAKRIIHKI